MKKLILALSVTALLCTALSSCSFFKKYCEHTYEEKVVPPTCTAEGYTDHTCTKCGDNYKDVYTQKVIHPYKSVIVSPTCTAEGYTEHTCLVCGDSYNDTAVQKLPHAYGEEVIAPTCTAEGYTKHTCSVCGDSYNDSTTAMTAHRFNGAPCTYCSMEEITENITPDTEWYSADNIQFTITTAEQLAGLAALVNEGTDFTSQVIYLDSNIDLGYAEWIPIGNETYSFKGTFNGKGHTISGLKINAAYSYVGLFGNVSGAITDFKVEDASVYLKDAYENVAIACGYSTSAITDVTVSGFIDAANSKYVGGIAGYMSLSSAIISKNESRAVITGGDYTGGLIGYLTATSTLQTDILSSTSDVSGAAYVGGIFGYVNAKVGSSVYGATVCSDIVGDYYVGGIVGKSDNVAVSYCSNDGSTVMANSYLTSGESFFVYLGGYVGCGYSVNNCVNNVEINYNSRGSYIGGIAGYLVNTVTSCENNGKINGYSNVGGIVGMINTSAALTISSLKNSGDVSGGSVYVGGIIGYYVSGAATTLSALENSGVIVGDTCVGGIIGDCDNGNATLTAANLVNTGDVTATRYRVGGLFGIIEASTSSLIKNSSSSANIKSVFKVGGLVGETTTVSIKDCSNEGSTITATGWYTDGTIDYVWLGGYVGLGYIITGCINNSDITYDGTGVYVGGIVGYATNNIQNCTNNGNITSKSSYVGGIVGYIVTDSNSFTYSDLFNTGNISGVDYISGIIGKIYQQTQQASLYKNEVRNVCSYDGLTHYNHYYYNYTTINNVSNSGDITATGKYAGAIIGHAFLDSVFDKRTGIGRHCDWGCGRNENYCNEYGAWILSATNVSNAGNIAGTSDVGELFGYVVCDAYSTLTTYTVTGSITVNGEVKEGNYDVGSNTNLTLSGREVYVPEVPEEDTENSENTENTENTETGATE